MKPILVTGAHGFIGRNLVLRLGRLADTEVISTDVDTPGSELSRGLDVCEVIFHLAGVNRPRQEEEFETGNVGSLAEILSELEKRKRRPQIVFSSSVQALLENPYGRSKRKAEELLISYAGRTNTPALIFRLPGVFGKWCRPNYNSVVATFCSHIARGIPIQIHEPARELELVHVDDVVARFIDVLEEERIGATFAEVTPVFQITLSELAKKLYEFKATRESLRMADLSDPFMRRLFGTYMSYLPSNEFAYSLEQRVDTRGSLTEILKAGGHGQFFVSRTKPGVTRGQHYHDTKVEKFLVLEGEALIKFRNLATGEKTEYKSDGRTLKIVDIPPGWTHSIQNVGQSEMIVLFWASEVFDVDRPDTYHAEV